jgi:membrane protease YdiL (CAAX protease family)
VVPEPFEPVRALAYEPPPAFSAPPYGAGPAPVGPDGPWSWSGPWNDLRYDPSLGYLAPVAPAPTPRPGTVFWPKTIAWMGIDPQRSRWGIPDIVIALVAFFVGGIILGGAVFVIGGAATGLGVRAFIDQYAGIINIISLFGQWGAVVGFLVLIARLKGSGSLRRDFGLAFSWWDPLIGAGAAVVTLLVSGMVQVVVAYLTGAPPASNSEAIFGDVVDNKPLLIVTVLLASIGAPLVEELLFRGLVLRALEKRLGAVVAVIGSSLIFGALHLFGGPVSPIALLAGITVYGLVFALLTRWWCRLGPAVFTHIWVNTLASAFVLVPILLK